MMPSSLFASLKASCQPSIMATAQSLFEGGKAMFQGHNSYRPGFNGGRNFKTSILPTSTPNGCAIAKLKQRLKSKHTSKPHQQNKK
jgi:hypothetical protein